MQPAPGPPLACCYSHPVSIRIHVWRIPLPATKARMIHIHGYTLFREGSAQNPADRTLEGSKPGCAGIGQVPFEQVGELVQHGFGNGLIAAGRNRLHQVRTQVP